MTTTLELEINIRESFRRVKTDILQLQKKITELAQEQERIMKAIADTKVRVVTSKVQAQKTVPVKKARPVYVASKDGNKLHVKQCPFAKNIKPKHRVEFRSKASAFNKGYKPCECMKKV